MMTSYTVALDNGEVKRVEAEGWKWAESSEAVYFFTTGTSELTKHNVATFNINHVVYVMEGDD